jgi:hypothetical protein
VIYADPTRSEAGDVFCVCIRIVLDQYQAMDSSSSNSFSSSSMDETASSMDENSSGSEDNLPTEDHSQDDELDSEGNFDQPLYPGAHLTFFESHLSVFQFALRHRLTKLAFSDLLNLIDNHLPTTNSMVSLYKLKKHFLHLYRDITYTPHFCCSSCHATLSTLESPCPNNCEDEAMEFMSLAVAPQLKRRLEGMLILYRYKDIDAVSYSH